MNANKKINEPIPAKINDELAVKFSAKNLNELKKNIKDRLSNEYKSFSKSLMKKELMDEIEKRVKFDLPQSLVDSELNQIIQQNSKNNVEIKKEKVSDKKKPTKEEKNLANRRVTLGLFLLKKVIEIIAASEKISRCCLQRGMNYPGKEDDFINYDKNPH